VPAAAHDFWIEPSAFRVKADERVKLGLRVGDHFKGEPVPRANERIVKFVAADAAGEKPVVGREGSDPAGLARFGTAGVTVVGYRSNNAFVELEGPKFEDYLKEKGLESIGKIRAEKGETASKTREAYSRCSMSLIRVGDGPINEGDRALGFTLEIIAETNPYLCKIGDEMRFRVLFEGKPLPNVLLFANSKADPRQPFTARTDEQGRVSFRLEKAGVWMIAGVHMTAAPRGVDAAWQSYWASLTFENGEK
jgi:uncharacterized GH25 family protein